MRLTILPVHLVAHYKLALPSEKTGIAAALMNQAGHQGRSAA
ncbi:MAG: hypothetical protein AAB241_02645 [Pseudomonadota bacterium]